METRRLQHIKGGSFTLSLPKRWVEKQKLRQGYEIALFEEEDGSITLYPIKPKHLESTEVFLNMEDIPEIRSLEYCIGTYYIQGSDRITITSEKIMSAEAKRRLKLLRDDLPGVEVAEERANAISFHVVIDPAAFLMDTLVEKTSSFAVHLQEDAVRSVVENNLQLAREVVERSREALRHYRMTIRQVAVASLNRAISLKVGVKNCRENVTFALIARDLNRLVYHSTSIATRFLNLEGKPTTDRDLLLALQEISETTLDMQAKAVEAFIKKDTMLAVKVMKQMRDIEKKEKALLTEILRKIKNADVAVAYSHMVRDLRRIAGYSVAIADDAMNRTLAPKP